MKILCISDQIDPLIYSNLIKERFSDVDIVLSAGDLPLEYLEFIVSSLNKPLFFVFGNHNLEELYHFKPQYEDRFKVIFDASTFYCGAIYVDSKIYKENDVIIMGLGGSIRYNNGPNQFTNFQMNLQIIKKIPRLLINKLLYGRYVDILLTHAPPSGIHDKPDPCHKGFKAFLWFMRVFKPKYLVHGHIHLYDLQDVRTTKYYNTLVINAYSHYLIDTEADS